VQVPPVQTRRATGTAAGHDAISARHAKTLEIVREHEIGPRASCVVGVGAAVDEQALATLRGRVALTIEAGGKRDTVHGLINPAFRPGDPLIVRLAGAIARDAVIVDADRAASDLDRGLVDQLRRREATVTLTFTETAGPVPGVLVVDPGELWGGTAEDALDADLSCSSPLDREAATMIDGALRRGSRVGLRARLHSDPEAVASVARAHDAGHTVLPVRGLAPVAAALAVAGVPIERLALADGRGKAGRLAPGTTRTAVGVRGDRAAGWLLGADRGLIALDVGTQREQYRPWRAGAGVEVPGGRARTAIVVAAAGPRCRQLDPAVAVLVEALLARGASPRDAVQALQRGAGLSRREAYELVLGADRRPQATSVSRPEPRTSR